MSILPKEVLRKMIVDGDLETVKYLKEMFKDALQEMLEADLEYAKGDKKNKNTSNRRNGTTKKTINTKFVAMELDIPRDRNGEFELVVVPKHTRDIYKQVKDPYGIEVSADMVSKITDKIIPQMNE